MQLEQGHSLSPIFPLCQLHKDKLLLLHPTSTSAQDGPDTLQLALVVFYLRMPTIVHLLMSTNKYKHTLQLAL